MVAGEMDPDWHLGWTSLNFPSVKMKAQKACSWASFKNRQPYFNP